MKKQALKAKWLVIYTSEYSGQSFYRYGETKTELREWAKGRLGTVQYYNLTYKKIGKTIKQVRPLPKKTVFDAAKECREAQQAYRRRPYDHTLKLAKQRAEIELDRAITRDESQMLIGVTDNG